MTREALFHLLLQALNFKSARRVRGNPQMVASHPSLLRSARRTSDWGPCDAPTSPYGASRCSLARRHSLVIVRIISNFR